MGRSDSSGGHSSGGFGDGHSTGGFSHGDNNSGNQNTGDNFSFDDSVSYGNYYAPLDKTYILTEIITTIIILLTALFTYIFTYKSSIIDPISDIKNSFINAQLTCILIVFIINIILNFFRKKDVFFIKAMTILTIVSIIISAIFIIKKIEMDIKYNSVAFETIYNKTISNVKNTKSKQSTPLLKNDKDIYIYECVKLYNIFKIKTYLILGLNILLTMLFLIQIFKKQKKKNIKVMIEKDDSILFDDVQNIKM